jgi:xanthine dehydrogenase molybdenum-binding subunit
LHNDLYTQTSTTGKATAPSNIAEHLEMGRGDVEQGFAAADVVVERTFRTRTVHQGYIEPDAETAWVREDGSVIVWANTQTTFTQRHELAVLLDLPVSRIRVVPTEVGGAFGGKESVRVSTLCVALSRQAGLPVRITLSREEVLRATGPATATVLTIKVGARHEAPSPPFRLASSTMPGPSQGRRCARPSGGSSPIIAPPTSRSMPTMW